MSLRSLAGKTLLLGASALAALLVAEGALRLAPRGSRLAAESAPRGVTRLQRGDAPAKPRPAPFIKQRLVFGASPAPVYALIERDADPRIAYKLRAKVDVVQNGIRISTSSLGFRGGELVGGKTRIVGIGDSVMFGGNVAWEKTYLRIAQAELSGVETVNTAVPGYTTIQEVATLERHIDVLDPSWVVVGFVGNDFQGVRQPFDDDAPPDRPGLLARRSYLYRLLDLRLQHLKARLRLDAGVEACLDSLRRLGEIARTRKLRVLVCLYPGFVESDASPDDLPFPEVLAVCREQGFETLHVHSLLLQALREGRIARSTDIWASAEAPTDPHPNQLGHEIIGQGLAARLRELLGTAP